MHRIKNLIALLSVLFSFWLMPSVALAQEAEASDATALVVTPLSFLKQRDLVFGTIIPSTSNGTVTMDSAGNVSTTSGIIHISGTQEPASFTGFGALNQIVRINIDADSHILTRNGGTQTILMDAILIGSRPPIVLDTRVRRFRIGSQSGIFAFNIAGRLQIPANALPGTYEGEFTVTLEYE